MNTGSSVRIEFFSYFATSYPSATAKGRPVSKTGILNFTLIYSGGAGLSICHCDTHCEYSLTHSFFL